MARAAWYPPGQSDEERDRQLFVTITGLRAFNPADEIEGMLAAQAMAMHHAAMECSRRVMIPDQLHEAAQGFRKAAASVSRAFVEIVAALDRKRGKGGKQVVRVEHVHVHPGGQAVVGNIATGGTGGGSGGEIREEPHAPRAGLARDASLGPSLRPLRPEDTERFTLPRAGNAERPLPHARRRQHRTEDAGGGGAHQGGADDPRRAQRRSS